VVEDAVWRLVRSTFSMEYTAAATPQHQFRRLKILEPLLLYTPSALNIFRRFS
jgi:hypothetical protein